MRTALLALVMLTAGCQWIPEEFPVKVDLDGALTDEQTEAFIRACERINDAVGSKVLHPVASNGRVIQKGRIKVRYEPGPKKARADYGLFGCEIEMRNYYDFSLEEQTDRAAHELLHCLGLGHRDEDPADIMNGEVLGHEIQPYAIEYLRRLTDVEEAE